MTPEPHQDQDFPYWLVIAAVIAGYLMFRVVTDDLYLQVLTTLSKGVRITIFVTLVAFALATVTGLLLAVASLSRFIFFRQIARFYIEIVRGIPMIVLLLYVAVVLAPALVALWNTVAEALGVDPIRTRDFSLMWRAIIALMIGYSAFIAEVFRAGLQSVDVGQVEAAEALGLSPWQRFRLVILPQAIRTIMPPLGNDFSAMIKDSSLAGIIGYMEFTRSSQILIVRTHETWLLLFGMGLFYFTICYPISRFSRAYERKKFA